MRVAQQYAGCPASSLGASLPQAPHSYILNHLPFVLSHGRQNVKGQARGLRHVAGDEVYAALYQVGSKSNIAGQAIQAGNQQDRAAIGVLRKAARSCGQLLCQRPLSILVNSVTNPPVLRKLTTA